MCCFRDSYERLRGSRELGILQPCPRCLGGLTAPDDDADDDTDDYGDTDDPDDEGDTDYGDIDDPDDDDEMLMMAILMMLC